MSTMLNEVESLVDQAARVRAEQRASRWQEFREILSPDHQERPGDAERLLELAAQLDVPLDRLAAHKELLGEAARLETKAGDWTADDEAALQAGFSLDLELHEERRQLIEEQDAAILRNRREVGILCGRKDHARTAAEKLRELRRRNWELFADEASEPPEPAPVPRFFVANGRDPNPAPIREATIRQFVSSDGVTPPIPLAPLAFCRNQS